jgi:hypothetical protein|tara:strand:+ start:6186 stop:6392 length:207 start_codon:yes stop_codon:yes gene_type:complete
MARSKSMRVPVEFEGFVDNLSAEFSRQTGFPRSKTATMRRMAIKLDGRLIVKGIDFDFAIFGKTKNKK